MDILLSEEEVKKAIKEYIYAKLATVVGSRVFESSVTIYQDDLGFVTASCELMDVCFIS